MANNFTQIVTPVGTAVYPHLRSTEKFEGEDTGKYTCSIKLNEADTEALITKIENEWEMAKKSPTFDGKKYSRNSNPTFGYHEDKNGDIVFKAKTNAVIKTKAGEIIEKAVTVFDKYGKPMATDIEVGNGSIIRVCLLLRPFYASGSVYGIQLLLKAVQVLEYVAPSAASVSATECGFECEEAPVSEDDIPFVDEADDDF